MDQRRGRLPGRPHQPGPTTAFPNLDAETATIGLPAEFVVDLGRTVDVTSPDIANPDAAAEIQGANRRRVYDRGPRCPETALGARHR